MVAGYGEQCIFLQRVGRQVAERLSHIIPVVLCIDQVSQMDSQRAVGISVIVADELLPVGTATIHVCVSGYEYVVTLACGVDDRVAVLVVVAERVIDTLVDTGR